jgi:hypothetical protein
VLAQSLSQQLEHYGVDVETRDAVVKYTRSSAAQLRLMLDGGWSWETAGTEWSIYRVTHPEASLSHRAFKLFTLLGALAVTPKSFYRVQRKIARNDLYQRARRRWLPIPEMLHIKKDAKAG